MLDRFLLGPDLGAADARQVRMFATPSPARLEGLHPVRGLSIPLARRLVRYVFGGHPTRRFAIRLWNGTEIRWRHERDFTLVFGDPSTFWSLVASGDPAAMAEAYMDGRLDIEGDIKAAVGLGSYLRRIRPPTVLGWLGSHKHEWTPAKHSPDADGQDVRAHYDLSDDFFHLFLDSQMVYSCAYFAHPEQNLDEAQERKLDLVCRKLHLRPGELFLDVGCGWGALPIWAAKHYGVRSRGITLSCNQLDAARARVAAAGLSDRVTIEERHYQSLEGAVFDKIASVGMIEHVGIANYGTYFAALYRSLRPGGLLLNHGITRPPDAAARNGGDFVLKHVFPGAEIDELSHTLAVMEQSGFEIIDVQSLRRHYALTLAAWNRRYAAHRAEAAQYVSKRTLRMWDLYLPGCGQAFEEGVVSVHQCLAAKPDERGAISAPLTREEALLF
jgi:cyclopropane-fatty-acyl-phospholipid synthase